MRLRRHMSSWMASGLLIACLVTGFGCSGGKTESYGYEGDEPGECEDNADNDRDNLFDCDDDGCAGSPVCTGTTPTTDTVAPTSDAQPADVAVDAGPATGHPILELLAERGCAKGGCHDSETVSSGLDVTSLDGLFADAAHGPSVVPCQPDASTLYTKLMDPPPFGFLMPIGDEPFEADDLETIHAWIASGAEAVETCEVALEDAGATEPDVVVTDADHHGFPDGGPEAPEDAFEPIVPGDGPTVFVSKSGSDSAECGDEGAPCATIAAGLAAVADTGGTVMVGEGEYLESELFVPSGVWLVSADGPLAAKIYSNDKSAVRFWEVDDAGIDGFEIYGDWNDGASGDGLVRVFDSNRITLRNGIFRDAPSDQDIIKVTGQVETLTLENLILLNPGKPLGSAQYQQLVEVFGSKASSGDVPSIRELTIRGCWFMQTEDVGGDDMLFLRASVEDVLIENNVFGPSSGPGGASRPAVHIGTYNGPQPDQNYPEVRDVVVRNNIFAGLRGDAALGVSNSHRVWVYSNVFYDNTGSKTRSVIAVRGNVIPVDELTVVDNIFMANHPEKSGGDLYWVREGGEPATFSHDYNLFQDNVLTSDVDYSAEAASLVDVDPLLDNPLTPPNWSVPDSLELIHSLYGGFLLNEGSPAINAGVDGVGMDGHPAWSDESIRRWDILGEPRPLAGAWDIGVHEPQP